MPILLSLTLAFTKIITCVLHTVYAAVLTNKTVSEAVFRKYSSN